MVLRNFCAEQAEEYHLLILKKCNFKKSACEHAEKQWSEEPKIEVLP
jgi:hypothetical protein